jgi:hypothetical protein
MFEYISDLGNTRINYHSNSQYASELNDRHDNPEYLVYHQDWFGGYCYPILDHFLSETNSNHYQILKINRPELAVEESELLAVLSDKNTLYAYPDAGIITVVQFDGWDNTSKSLSDIGVNLKPSQKVFKRIKTFNRPFRAFRHNKAPIRVMLIGDTDFTEDSSFISDEDAEKLFDGAFIISQTLVDECMTQLDNKTLTFVDNDPSGFVVNRNSQVKESYIKEKIFNARIFGEMDIINDGEYPYLGAIKGEAYTDAAGICEYYGVDVIAPYSAFKTEVNFTDQSFVLIEPQPAKMGQLFSDGQTIANLPSLYQYKQMKFFTTEWFTDAFNRLVNNEVMESHSNLSIFNHKDSNAKIYRDDDINSLIEWNVRAWLMCGGKITDSPWLFEQMGKNLHQSMRISDSNRMRFPIPCAVRAFVITGSLYRAIQNYPIDEFSVELGTAFFCDKMKVLVVNDNDYIEMYPSHGGCDLDDSFQIYWRTINNERKIIICRSPNDLGEYSIFNYIEGNWHSKTTYNGTEYSFIQAPSDPDLWPDRLSEVIEAEEISYTGLPSNDHVDYGVKYNADFIMEAIKSTSSSAASVGINVNARQLWSASVGKHRLVQVASMEDCIDAGVQGGTEEQVQAVIEDAAAIMEELISNNIPVDAHLWMSKHAQFHPKLNPEKFYSNVSYLQSVRFLCGKDFMNQIKEYSTSIAKNADYSEIRKLGAHYLAPARSLMREYRRGIAKGLSVQSDNPNFDYLSDTIVSYINLYEEGHHRNSFVMSLYLASLTTSTASGKITDQFVMQPAIFSYLLTAMQFYGLLGTPVASILGGIDRQYSNIGGYNTAIEFQNSEINSQERTSNANYT